VSFAYGCEFLIEDTILELAFEKRPMIKGKRISCSLDMRVIVVAVQLKNNERSIHISLLWTRLRFNIQSTAHFDPSKNRWRMTDAGARFLIGLLFYHSQLREKQVLQ